MARLRFVVAIAPLLALACSAERIPLAPDRAVLGGMDLHLTVALNRDFQCCVSDGSLQAVVVLTAPDSLMVPSGVTADSISVVNGNATWTAALGQLFRAPGYAEFVAREGPKWTIGASVDVYVVVHDGARRQLLEAARQQITSSF